MDDDYNPEMGEVNDYTEEGREQRLADDEIQASEEGFMKGYDEAAEEKEEESEDEEGEEKPRKDELDF